MFQSTASQSTKTKISKGLDDFDEYWSTWNTLEGDEGRGELNNVMDKNFDF